MTNTECQRSGVVLAPVTARSVAFIMLWKVVVELLRATILEVSKTVDRLAADPDRMAFNLHSACGLFRRPANLEPVLDSGLQLRMDPHLAMDSTTFLIHDLRGNSVVAV